MTDDIRDSESAKYNKIWELDAYRKHSPAMRIIDRALTAVNIKTGSSIIDLGCGTGRASQRMANLGYNVTAFDIAEKACLEFDGDFIEGCLWDMPDLGQFDLGVAFDVLEHIPTEMIDLTLENMARHCKTLYLQIATFPDPFGEKIGETLHLTLEPLEWWREKLLVHYKTVRIETRRGHHIAICKERIKNTIVIEGVKPEELFSADDVEK